MWFVSEIILRNTSNIYSSGYIKQFVNSSSCKSLNFYIIFHILWQDSVGSKSDRYNKKSGIHDH
jgi:hypothetical protein